MLATECSSPAATKAAIGGMITSTLSAALRAPKASQTARQTSMLAKIPLARAVAKSSVVLV